MQVSFTLIDLCGILVALPFFTLFLFAPGYVLAFATNIFSFRTSSFKIRTLIAVPLSVCVSPILANLLAHALSIRTCALFFMLFPVLMVLSLVIEWKQLRPQLLCKPRKSTLIAFSFALAWIVICLFSLPDFEIGHRLYSTTAVFDHSVRASLISSAQRTGAPPANPFFYYGGVVRVRYYYYWNVLCALLATLTGLGARSALFGSCIWSGFALACLIPLYLREFIMDVGRLRRTSVIGIALLTVTGLDLLPTALDILVLHHPNGDMEWWEANQVTSWLDSLIWAPHHVAGLVAGMTGLLLILEAVKTSKYIGRISGIVLAALAFASAGGLSVYVTIVFAAFLTVWMIRYLVRRDLKSFGILLAAGALALLMSLPYLHELRANAGPPTAVMPGAQSAGFLTFAIRASHYLSPESRSLSDAPLQLMDMVLTYIIEFGFYFFAGVFMLRRQLTTAGRKQLTESQKACLYLFAVSLLLTSFVRSSVIQGNDLGFRGILPAQFILLIWAAVLIQGVWPARCARPNLTVSKSDRAVLFATLLLGVLGSAYQLGMLRLYPILRDKGVIKLNVKDGQPSPPDIGSDSYLIRLGYTQLDRRIPANAIVQFNPASVAVLQMAVYHRYQSVDAFAPECGTAFGGSLQKCKIVQSQLQPLFDPGASSVAADDICRSLSIDVLIAQQSDPVWKSASSWVWTRQPLAANEYVRAIACGQRKYEPGAVAVTP